MEPFESDTDSHSFSSNLSSSENREQDDENTSRIPDSKKVRFSEDHSPEPNIFGPSENDTETDEDEESSPLTTTTSSGNIKSNDTDSTVSKSESESLNLNTSTSAKSPVNDDSNKSTYNKFKTNLFSMPRKLMNGTVFSSQFGSERAIDVGHLDPHDDNKSINNNSVLPSANPDNNHDQVLIKQVKTEEDHKPLRRNLTCKEKSCRILFGVAKALGLLFSFYLFVCSLDLLSDGFRLVGGRAASEIFKNSAILQNPVVGVMIGILTTVLVQSSSTSTSIIVGMVSADFLTVQTAIPIIMGANIGTSITNTIVSFSQAGDREKFRLAFAGATLLDMFNWLSVIVLLTVEVLTGYLYHTSSAIMKGLVPKEGMGEFQLLSVLTKPFVDLIVQLDQNVMDCWANPNCTEFENSSLILEYCHVRELKVEVFQSLSDTGGQVISQSQNVTIFNISTKCDFIFAGTSLSDRAAGAIILVTALIVLCSCLVFMVKILSSILQGHVAVIIKKTLNANIPYVPWLTGYIAILVGTVMTFLVQSSSVFTSALTPLIGLEVISLERAYPLTLGANIGTTTTAVLASMAVQGKAFVPSMQIALCHVLFNVTGIILFYPIPYLRFPLPMAKFLGKITSKYRWFAIFYLVMMFGILPAITIGLAFTGRIPVIIIFSILGLVALFIVVLTVLQRKKPSILPAILQSWKFLPLPMRSLQPYDDFFTRCACCQKCKGENASTMDKKASSLPFKENKDNTQIPSREEGLAIQHLQASPVPLTRRRDLSDNREKNHNTYHFGEDEV